MQTVQKPSNVSREGDGLSVIGNKPRARFCSCLSFPSFPSSFKFTPKEISVLTTQHTRTGGAL
jgi:hypothetical protein